MRIARLALSEVLRRVKTHVVSMAIRRLTVRLRGVLNMGGGWRSGRRRSHMCHGLLRGRRQGRDRGHPVSSSPATNMQQV